MKFTFFHYQHKSWQREKQLLSFDSTFLSHLGHPGTTLITNVFLLYSVEGSVLMICLSDRRWQTTTTTTYFVLYLAGEIQFAAHEQTCRQQQQQGTRVKESQVDLSLTNDG
jgi:hypothetical protein